LFQLVRIVLLKIIKICVRKNYSHILRGGFKLSIYKCSKCNGKGEHSAYGDTWKCSKCNGLGHIKINYPHVTCPKCNGKGEHSAYDDTWRCETCGGKGVIAESRLVQV